jgi:hypothetical protein
MWRAAAAALALLAAAAPAAHAARAHGVPMPHRLARLERLEHEVRFLRAQTAQLLCKGMEDEALPSGAWCLREESRVLGFPIAPLHFLDAGVAPGVQQLLAGGSVLDVGAGSGQYGHYLISRDPSYGEPEVAPGGVGERRASDAHAAGPRKYEAVDGALNVEPFTDNFVRWADLTQPYAREGGPADWVLSLEVGEHVPAQFEGVYLDTLHRNNRCGVLLSWAVPGQDGKGHVNTLRNEEVQARMAARGYAFDAAAAAAVRAKAELPWFQNTFMVRAMAPVRVACRCARGR